MVSKIYSDKNRVIIVLKIKEVFSLLYIVRGP